MAPLKHARDAQSKAGSIIRCEIRPPNLADDLKGVAPHIMKTEDAKRALEAARVKAAEIGKPVSVAIVDSAGCMVLFERIDDAPPFTAVVAEAKACGSAFTGRDSAMLNTMAQNNPAIIELIGSRLAGQRFATVQGAVPIRDASGLAGAIGVSGATSQEDEDIARAGAAVLAP